MPKLIFTPNESERFFRAEARREKLYPKPVRGRQQRAGDLLVEAIGLMDKLLDYVKHTGTCPHPHKKCDCGLPEVLVKAKRFAIFLSATLAVMCLAGCTTVNVPSFPSAITALGEKSRQQAAAANMDRLAAPQAVVSRPDPGFALVNVPPTHTVRMCSGPSLSLEEFLDRWRTNRSSLIILVTQPTTNAPGPQMPSRRKL